MSHTRCALSLSFAQVDRRKRAKSGNQEPVARISSGIPNRHGNPRHLEIDGVRFRCNWRHRVRVTSPTSSPTSRSRMHTGYIENVRANGTRWEEAKGPTAREAEIRVHPGLVMRTGTSRRTRRLLFARSITITYGRTGFKGWIEGKRESKERKITVEHITKKTIDEPRSFASLEDLFFTLLHLQYISRVRRCSPRY